ncbi:putative ribonuclease H-like domain-containing protein, partial [Tanacetum coccineum]
SGLGPKWLFDIDVLIESMNYMPVVVGTNSNDSADGSLFNSSLKDASNDEPRPFNDVEKKDDEGGIYNQESPEKNAQDVNIVGPIPSTPNTRIHKDHSLENHVIEDVQSDVQTRKMTRTTNEQGFISTVYEEKTHENLQNCLFACLLSQVKPKKKVWTLVDLPYGKRAIGTKWVYKNKKDERGIVIRNKARLVAQDFIVYQMDVKIAFMYGKIEVEVYVCQPLGFEDPEFPDKVYKVEKALYGLHQTPRAWYETLSTYSLDNGFQRS